MGKSSFSSGITDVMQAAFYPWVAFYLFFICNVLNYNINDIVLLIILIHFYLLIEWKP